ncbi:MAG: MarR family transcriptional regulator [Candidatus Hydrogenedentota bacterium]
MNSNSLTQARYLAKTIKHLQNRMLEQHEPSSFEGSGLAAELTTTQLSTLIAVRDHHEMTLKEIAETTSVSPPSASTMVDKMVEAGALSREHSKIDRREVRVSISPQGEKAVEALEEHLLGSLIDLLNGIGPKYANMWCEVYEAVEQYMDETEKRDVVQQGTSY